MWVSSHCLVCAFCKEFAVTEVEVVTLEILWPFDMLVPDDEVKINGYDTFKSVDLCSSAFGFPVLKVFHDCVVVMRCIAMNHSVEIGFVFPVEGFRFVD